jgi:hypothetical protein
MRVRIPREVWKSISCECCELSSSLWRADHSSRGVPPIVVCLNECYLETSTMRSPRPTRVVEPWKKNMKFYIIFATPTNTYSINSLFAISQVKQFFLISFHGKSHMSCVSAAFGDQIRLYVELFPRKIHLKFSGGNCTVPQNAGTHSSKLCWYSLTKHSQQ